MSEPYEEQEKVEGQRCGECSRSKRSCLALKKKVLNISQSQIFTKKKIFLCEVADAVKQ